MTEVLFPALLAVFPILVVIAALKDITSYTIPNWISAALIVSFFPIAFLAGAPLVEIGWSLGLGVGFLLLGMALFFLRVVGGGDAKLLAAIALWMGLGGTATYIFYTALIGGLLALALVSARSMMPQAAAGPGWFGKLMEPKAPIPYGLAIAIGGLLAFPSSTLFGLGAA